MAKPRSKATTDEFEVECVRAIRYNSESGTYHCLVKWKDFDETHTGWEPLDNLANAQESVNDAHVHLAQKRHWSWEFYLAEPSVKPPLPAGWHPYDAVSQAAMNAYFQKYCEDAKQMNGQIECVRSGKFHYMLDFEKMHQTNVSVATHTQRPVRCIPHNVPQAAA
jgi:hypothetical protein